MTINAWRNCHKKKLLIRSAVDESQLLFHKQTIAHIYYLQMAVWASTLRLHLPVQIQVISSTEVEQL